MGVVLTLSDFNLLVLDEPTEHLDIDSRERLEEALRAYEGTLILVSHDRYLLERVCTKILAIEEGRIVTYHVGYNAYQERRRPCSPDERLLLEVRLAELGAKLAEAEKGSEEYQALAGEQGRIARALRTPSGGAPGRTR